MPSPFKALPCWSKRGALLLLVAASFFAATLGCQHLAGFAATAATQPASWQAATTQAAEAGLAGIAAATAPVTAGLSAALAAALIAAWRLLLANLAKKAALLEVDTNPLTPPLLDQVSSLKAKQLALKLAPPPPNPAPSPPTP